MTCQKLSDRMPEVAAGRSTWGADEERHFNECEDCRAEWRVVLAAAGLGRAEGAAVDGERVAAAVLQRLRTEPVGKANGPRAVWWIGGLAAAAAVVALLVNPGEKPHETTPAAPVAFTINLTELDSLTVDQLEAVLESMEAPLSESSTLTAPSLEELDDQQLERVLRAMEG